MKLFFTSIIIIAVSSKVELPETKPLRGGIFSWIDALKGQRKLWGTSDVLKYIKIYDGEPDLSSIINKVIDETLDFNVTEFFSGFFGGGDSDTNTNKAAVDKHYYSRRDGFVPENKDIPGDGDFSGPGDGDFSGPGDGDFSGPGDGDFPGPGDGNFPVPKPSTGFTNVDLVGDIFGFGSLGMTNEELDKFLGQVFSYLTIVTLLIVFFVISFVFYIIFCFGCCCCCRSKTRDCPNIVSIIFFVCAIGLMFIATIMMFVSVSDLFKFLDLAFVKGKLQPLVDLVIDGIANSFEGLGDKGLFDIINKPIQGISTNITNFLAGSMEQFVDTINSMFDSIESLATALNGFSSGFNDTIVGYNAATRNVNRECETFFQGESFEIFIDPALTDVDKFIEPVNNVLNNVRDSKKINDIVKKINDSIVPKLESLADSINISDKLNSALDGIRDIKNDINIDEMLSAIHEPIIIELPLINTLKLDIPVAVRGLFYLTPVLMLVLTLVFAAVFWTKCCCSRCIASCACCQPCCCSICMLILGLLGTLFGFLGVFMVTTIIDEGDNAINHVIDKMFVNREIQIPNISIGGGNNIEFEPISIGQITLFKSLFESDKKTPLSEFFPIADIIPFDQFGNMIKKSGTNLVNSVNLSSITEGITGFIDDIQKSDIIPTSISSVLQPNSSSNLTQSLIDQIEKINGIPGDQADTEPCRTSLGELTNLASGMEGLINGVVIPVDDSLKSLTKNIDNISGEINNFVSGVIGVVNKLIESLGDLISSFPELINEFDAEPFIGLLNIFKTTILYNAMHSMICMSISAHLFLVGSFMMVLLIWIRRRGMARDAASEKSYSSYSYSYSYSYSSAGDKHRKKKGKNAYSGSGSGHSGKGKKSDSSSSYSRKKSKQTKQKHVESGSSDDGFAEGKQEGHDAYVF